MAPVPWRRQSGRPPARARTAPRSDAELAGGRCALPRRESGGALRQPARRRAGLVDVSLPEGRRADEQPHRTLAAAGSAVAQERLWLPQRGGLPFRRADPDRRANPAPAKTPRPRLPVSVLVRSSQWLPSPNAAVGVVNGYERRSCRLR